MHDKKQGKFLDGFFWGAVIGGGLSYLLSNKKGRDFLKDIIEDGIDALESATAPEPETLTDMPIVEEVPAEEAYSTQEVHPVEHKMISPDPQPKEQPPVKKTRFFKKAPKK